MIPTESGLQRVNCLSSQVTKSRGSSVSHNSHNRNNSGMQKDSLKHDVAVFTGFKPALEACYLDWDEYILPGITYTAGSNPMYHCPFTCFRHAGDTRTEVNQVSIAGHFSNKLFAGPYVTCQCFSSGEFQFSCIELSTTDLTSSQSKASERRPSRIQLFG